MPVDTDPEQDEQQEELVEGQMSFLDHLEELRKRIIYSLVSVGVALLACFAFADNIFNVVTVPIRSTGTEMIALKPTEAFNVELKLALIAAVFLSAPLIVAQVWLFISPGLYKHERRYALPFILSSSLLFILGGVFGYVIVFPYALQFLIKMAHDIHIVPRISAAEYVDLFFMIELGLGIVFEIPALIFILARIGLVTPGFLLRNMRYAILIAFAVAAIITPTTDMMTMMMMAVPMIALYLLGIVVAFVFGKKRSKEPDS